VIGPTRRTPRQWVEYLSQEEQPVTLDEYIAGCLGRILGAQTVATQAAEHTEGMLGAIDGLAEQIASRSGLPYASSGAVRAALDDARDRARRLAAAETET
jgi:hypothetical protein